MEKLTRRRYTLEYSAGTLCQIATSQPFGDDQQISGTCNPSPAFFTGLERDSESGLDHAMFRQYASTSGRWMSPDPYDGSMDIGNPQSFNRYSYVNNRALNFTDPSGLEGDGGAADLSASLSSLATP
jgi:RHS repeat-associated protein